MISMRKAGFGSGDFLSGLVEQGGSGEQGNYRDTTRFDRLAATFFTIYQNKGESNFSSSGLDDVHRFEGGSSGGDDIIDDDDAVSL
jgi:hypothetical protein